MFKNIKVLIYDFDGVMTDNKVHVDENGRESVSVNRSDGLAISILKKMGFSQFILSTETNPVVSKRAEKLQISCIQSCEDKKTAILAYSKQNKIELNQILFVGNDINDLEAMKIIGIKVVPNDAHSSVKNITDICLKAKGGDGVIRELLDLILELKSKT
ncbi:HAD hydrolase family protein [bacterium]|jgi:3-deoxy-D-manno-octulosonate 8-phosphate phosphatase (KDO 8-P phosphatase)|nr:HAD hydrolase family protein [bacterium]